MTPGDTLLKKISEMDSIEQMDLELYIDKQRESRQEDELVKAFCSAVSSISDQRCGTEYRHQMAKAFIDKLRRLK